MTTKGQLSMRQDFPVIQQYLGDKPLVYFDNAATTQLPACVITAMYDYYHHDHANIHRGFHTLAYRATEQYEAVREEIARWLNAPDSRDVILTSGTTEALNLVALGYGEAVLTADDVIWVSLAEHHANLVPWQQVAKRTGAQLRFLPLLADGRVDCARFRQEVTPHSKILAVAHQSNVLGGCNDVAQLAAIIHEVGGIIVVDGAQAVAHHVVDVQQLDCDFYAFSGHKCFAPTGVGVLYGKRDCLELMRPTKFGGQMIAEVATHESTWAEIPWRFEGGTPNIAAVIGLGAAIQYWQTIDRAALQAHETALTARVLDGLRDIPGTVIYGPQVPAAHHGIVSFNLASIHAHDVATALDMSGIAVRAGHHCTQPLMRHLGVPATVRMSVTGYNTIAEVDIFLTALREIKEFFTNGTI